MDWVTNGIFEVMYLKQLVMIDEKRWVVLGHNGLNEPCYVTNDSGENWTLWDSEIYCYEFY